jgi:hypothetical protein
MKDPIKIVAVFFLVQVWYKCSNGVRDQNIAWIIRFFASHIYWYKPGISWDYLQTNLGHIVIFLFISYPAKSEFQCTKDCISMVSVLWICDAYILALRRQANAKWLNATSQNYSFFVRVICARNLGSSKTACNERAGEKKVARSLARIIYFFLAALSSLSLARRRSIISSLQCGPAAALILSQQI